MRDYSLLFPDHFDEEAPIIASKGRLDGVTIIAGRERYLPEFYDPVRLEQTVADEVARSGHAALDNIIVVPEVTRARIEGAVRRLADERFVSLRPRPR